MIYFQFELTFSSIILLTLVNVDLTGILWYNRHEVNEMSIKDRTTHLMVILPVELDQEIKKYQDTHNIRGKNETIRALIKKGLEADIE